VSAEGPPSGESEEARGIPFPDSLCHKCAAPVRYIKTSRSTFLYCPIFKLYPPQPVRECDEFRPKPAPEPERP
jgi:hypothetical protein